MGSREFRSEFGHRVKENEPGQSRVAALVSFGVPIPPHRLRRVRVHDVFHTRDAEQVEVDVAHDVGRGPLGRLEAGQQHVVADAVGLGVEGHVAEAVSRLEGAHLDRAEVVGPAAAVDVLLRAEVEVVGGDVTRAAPLGAGQDAAEQAGRVRAVVDLAPGGRGDGLRRRRPRPPGGHVQLLAATHQRVHVGEAERGGLRDRGQVLKRLARHARLVDLDEFAVLQLHGVVVHGHLHDGDGLVVEEHPPGRVAARPDAREPFVRRRVAAEAA